jgi:hypothetical protein
MEGIPLEVYKPLPPNPLEDNYRREVENRSDAGSAITPPLDNLEGALVMVENPTISMSVTPLEPLLVHSDSLGNVIYEKIPRLPERIFTETYMGSTEPIFGDEYRTLVCPSTAVETNPTPTRSVWRTSSGRDLYEHFESFRQPFQPHDPLSETGPSGQTMNHPVDRVIHPTTTPAQVHPSARLITSTHPQSTSISTPVSTSFYSTAPHVPHNPAGTSSHPRMQTPAGQTQPDGGKPPSNEPFPPRGLPLHGRPTPPGGQPTFHAPPGGQPPFSSHTLVANPPLAAGQPSFAGKYLQVGIFTQPHIGGNLYNNPLGGVSNPFPSGTSYGQSYPGDIPNTTWSSLGPQSYPPHGPHVYPPPGSTP